MKRTIHINYANDKDDRPAEEPSWKWIHCHLWGELDVQQQQQQRHSKARNNNNAKIQGAFFRITN